MSFRVLFSHAGLSASALCEEATAWWLRYAQRPWEFSSGRLCRRYHWTDWKAWRLGSYSLRVSRAFAVP